MLAYKYAYIYRLLFMSVEEIIINVNSETICICILYRSIYVLLDQYIYIFNTRI